MKFFEILPNIIIFEYTDLKCDSKEDPSFILRNPQHSELRVTGKTLPSLKKYIHHFIPVYASHLKSGSLKTSKTGNVTITDCRQTADQPTAAHRRDTEEDY